MRGTKLWRAVVAEAARSSLIVGPNSSGGRIRSEHRLATREFSLVRVCLCMRPWACQVSGFCCS